MRLTITLDDDVHARYLELAREKKLGVEAFVQRYLETTVAAADPKQRVLLVDSVARAALEDILQVGQLATAAQLVDRVGKLARLSIGEVTVPLTAVQHEELRRKAIANNKTYEEYARDICKQIAQEFLISV